MLRKFFKKYLYVKRVILSVYFFSYFVKYYFIFQIKGIFRVLISKCSKNSFNDIKKLKNSQIGRRCFIVATGPSLTLDDVNNLQNELTFGLNSIFKYYDKTDWRPDYYIMADLEQLRQQNALFFEDKAKICSFTDSFMRTKFNNSSNLVYLYYNRLMHGLHTFFDYDFKISYNPIFAIYDYYTVTNLAILLAVYMGFKEIYLIGVDCNYMGQLTHAEGLEEEDSAMNSDDMKIYTAYSMKKGYEYINKKLSKKGIKIYNATRGGALEVFPRVNLDDVLENKEV